jgi:hypothetical protein
MAIPVFGGTDVLTLGADWEPIDSTGSESAAHAEAPGDDGDVVAEQRHDIHQTGTIKYHYIGAETGFIAAILAASALPGKLIDSTLQILGVEVDYDPCAQGELPICAFTVTDGPTADPTTPFWYTSDLTLPTYVSTANLIVPPILSAVAGDAEIVSCKWGLTCQAGRSKDKDGLYLAGRAYKGQETINHTWRGVPTSITASGWIQTAGVAALVPVRSNAGYNDIPYTFVRKVTRSTT